MTDEVFADGLIGVVVSGHVVRIDFASQAMPGEVSSDAMARAGVAPGQQDRAPMLPRQRIVMPLDGFAQSFGVLEQVMSKLIADGLVKRNAASEAPAAIPPGGHSPNFPRTS